MEQPDVDVVVKNNFYALYYCKETDCDYLPHIPLLSQEEDWLGNSSSRWESTYLNFHETYIHMMFCIKEY